MQGQMWSSNQRPPPQYQERFPPQYQERFPPRYQDVRNEAQFNGQFYNTAQTRFFNGQQEATNQRNTGSFSDNSFGPVFQQNSQGFDRQSNWTHPQSQSTAFNPQQNSNAFMHQGAFRTQSFDSSSQNYRNTGHHQDAMHWSSQSNYGGSVGNSRSWNNHMSNNGSFCQRNNQQQTQRTSVHHQQRQQWSSNRHSGKKLNKLQFTRVQSSSSGINNPAHSQTADCYTSGNSSTPQSEAQSNSSLPSNNFNQSPVNQQELQSNAGPDILVTQSQNNQSVGHQPQSKNNVTYQMKPTIEAQSMDTGIYNVNRTSQMQPTIESQSLNNQVHNITQTSQIRQTIEAQTLNNGTYSINHTSQIKQTIESQSLNNEVNNINQTSQIRLTTEAQSPNNRIYNVNQTSQITTEAQNLNNGIHNTAQTSQIKQTIESQSLNNGIYIVNQTSPIKPTSESQSLNNGIYNVILISQMAPTNETQSTNNGIYEVLQVSQARLNSEAQSTNNGIFNIIQTLQTNPNNEAQSTNTGIYNVNQTSQTKPTNEPQSINNGTYNINEASQTRRSNEAQTLNEIYNVNQTSHMRLTDQSQLQPQSKYSKDSLIYKLLCSGSKSQAYLQQSTEISHGNTCPERTKICETNGMDIHSKEPFTAPSAQCTVEPPSKRIKYGVVQRDYWNKKASVSKDTRDLCGTHQMGSNEQRQNRTSQNTIQYSTDPADCLEAVFALQKAAQQCHKAIAIVPPISQQIPNAAHTESPKNEDSSPLKIDNVWSLVKESDAQKVVDEEMCEPPSQTEQQDESIEIKSASNTAAPETCSTSPVECQADVQQGDSDVDGSSFDLSSAPVIKHTLENLRDLVKSLEMTQLSASYPEQSESVLSNILKLYWNGNHANIVKPFQVFRNEMMKYSFLKEIVEDCKLMVFESIETENLKKLVHCDILNTEMYSLSDEFRSSWLNVDGQPADIEKVLSEPMVHNMTVFKAVPQSCLNNTGATSTNLRMNSPKDLPKFSYGEKSVNPESSSPTYVFTPQTGNDSKEMAFEKNGHSYVNASLDNTSSKEEVHKEEENNKQNSTPSADTLIDKVSIHHSGQTNGNHSPSVPLPNGYGGNVSDGVKSSDVSISTKTLCNSTLALQVEDISDDENPGDKEALNSSADILLIEDISDDKNPGNTETLHNSADIWLVEDISDDENPGNTETLNISADIWLVEDISDDENVVNKEVPSNASEKSQTQDLSDDQNQIDNTSKSLNMCIIEDVSNDENSSDDSLLMEVTVLSSEDAKTLYQQLEDEPKCTIQTISNSDFDSMEIEACFDVPRESNHEYKENTCSQCSKMVLPNTTGMFKKDSDGDNFCNDCWEQAPLLELEEEPFSPSRKDVNILDFAAKSDKQGQHCYSPLELETKEQAVASTDQGLTGQRIGSMVQSDLEDNCSPPSPAPEPKITDSTVTVTVDCIAHNEGFTEQKNDSVVTKEQNSNPTTNELEVMELHVSSPETCIAEQLLSAQKVLQGQSSCLPHLNLQINDPADASSEVCMEQEQNNVSQGLGLQDKEPSVASTNVCIEGLAGQESHSEIMSELEQEHIPPCLELNVIESNIASPESCIAANEMTEQKCDFMEKLQLIQNRSMPCSELEVMGPNNSSSDKYFSSNEIARQNMVKSVTKTKQKTKKSAKQGLTKTKQNKQKTEKTKNIRLPRPQPLLQHNKPHPTKSVFSNQKIVSCSTGSEGQELFAPDIVVKKNWPQKKKSPVVSSNKRPGVESLTCNKMKKFKVPRQASKDRTSTNQKKSQKVEEKVLDSLHGSEKNPKPHSILTVNKSKTMEPKKVRFDLYGSQREKQCYSRERRFSAPATLTISDSCNEYTDVLSAKQKVHNLWSSTYIPKSKALTPRREGQVVQQEGSPQKIKPQKTQDILKSSMSALKSHLTQRAMLKASRENKPSHFKKPVCQQKLTKTLSI